MDRERNLHSASWSASNAKGCRTERNREKKEDQRKDVSGCFHAQRPQLRPASGPDGNRFRLANRGRLSSHSIASDRRYSTYRQRSLSRTKYVGTSQFRAQSVVARRFAT